MRVASVCLSVCFLYNIANIFVTGSRFKYHQYRRYGATCSICYMEECWPLEEARCEYYLLSGEGRVVEEGGRTSEVDQLMYEFVEEATLTDTGRDCIPFITYYTDCQKENSCLGCKSCLCDSAGRWNCIEEQQCRGEKEVIPDHRVLNAVIDALAYNDQRKKRSLPTSETLTTSKPQKVSYVQLAEWMYGVKPSLQMNFEKNKPQSENATNQNTESESTSTPQKVSFAQLAEWMYGVKPSLQMNFERSKPQTFSENATNQHTEKPFKQTQNSKENIDYIDLDDVLNTIGFPVNNKRRKAKLEEKSYDSHEFIDINEVKNAKPTDDFIDVFNALKTDDNNKPESSTKVVIDLLVPSYKNESFNFLSDYAAMYDIEEDTNNSSLQVLLNTSKNIMKRQVSNIVTINGTETVTIKHDTEKTNTNINDSNVNINSLTEDVLNPINTIISEKEKEIKYLFKVKQNLQSFIKSYNETEITLSMKNNTKSNNDSFSIYKLDIYPELQYDLRKINPNSLDKLLYKLKRDIYEVVRDISGIQKISKSRDLPDDLRALTEAMKFYIRNKNPKIKTQNIKANTDKDTLRRNSKFYKATPIANRLIDILKLIDKNMLDSYGLSSLTPSSRKIVKRVIKNYFYDGSLNKGILVYDPEYNLTNNLREIGVNWNRYIEILDNCDNTQVIYALKLLHYGLSSDIVKIADALALVSFAHSRRMVPVEGQMGEQLTDGIINGLKTINDKIEYFTRFNKKQENYEKHEIKKTKKHSFLKKIKNLLKGAQKDIGHLFQNKHTKSEIIKALAKQKLGEINNVQMNEYENTMKKWQNNLHILRKKRSMSRMENIRSRLTNIIPKYLRGKLNPAINANKKKAKSKKVTGLKNEGVTKSVKKKQPKVTTPKHKMKHTTKRPKTSVRHVTTLRPSLRLKTTLESRIAKILNSLTKG